MSKTIQPLRLELEEIFGAEEVILAKKIFVPITSVDAFQIY